VNRNRPPSENRQGDFFAGLRVGGFLLLLPAVLSVCRADPLGDFRGLADNRIAVRTSFGVRRAQPLGDTQVQLILGMSVTRACERAASYRIISFHDDNYSYAKFVPPRKASSRAEIEAEGPAGCPFARFERTIVTLDLPNPMKEGVEYFVLAQGSQGEMVTGAHTAQGFVFRKGQARPAGDDAVDLAVLGLRQLEPVGPGILKLEFGPNFSADAAPRPQNYLVRVAGKPLKVAHLGRISRIDTYLPTGWPFAAIPMHEVFLQLEAPFHDADLIEVEVNRAVTAAANRASLRFNEKQSLSNSIKVNQVGYLIDSPVKLAYLGRWLGSFPEKGQAAEPREDRTDDSVAQAFWDQLHKPKGQPEKPAGNAAARLASATGALTFNEPPEFDICREEDLSVVFRGKARLVHRSGEMNEGYYKVDHSGENVYLLDFTSLTVPGRYFVTVPLVGRSLPFEIGDNVYKKAFEVQAYGLFAQRCGIELGPPYSEWRRIACHKTGLTLTTQLHDEPHEIQKDLPRNVVRRALDAKPDQAPVVISAYGGHHDAGDYNPRSHLDVAQTLMDAYEMAPRKFYDGQLNIPEKGNAIPDILDEAHWALRLWLDLQDKDGGVYHGTESAGDPNFIETVELDRVGDYAYAKDAAASYCFAGATAQASRLWRSLGKTREAEDLLARARRAYAWAENHAPRAKTPQQYASGYLGPKAYAAAQLLHTTEEARFNKDFLDVCVWSRKPDAEIDVYTQYDQSLAAWAYVNCSPATADARVQQSVRRAIIERADMFIRECQTMAYGFIRHPMAPINWGTGAYENYLPVVIWSYKLTGDVKYRTWIVRTCDNTLGANPLNRSFIVGLGTRTVRAPLHNSRYCHLGEVVPGQQVEGPVQNANGYRVAEIAYPPVRENFASLQTFVDCHFAIDMDEGVVASQAKTMAAFGLLLRDRD
jgi:endoglucanase